MRLHSGLGLQGVLTRAAREMPTCTLALSGLVMHDGTGRVVV